MRLKLTLAYDGTGFRGWARQPGERTVEGELRAALARGLRVVRRARRRRPHRHRRARARERRLGRRRAAARRPSGPPRRSTRCCPTTSRSSRPRRRRRTSTRASRPRSRSYRYRIWRRRERSPFELHRSLWHPRPLDLERLNDGGGAARSASTTSARSRRPRRSTTSSSASSRARAGTSAATPSSSRSPPTRSCATWCGRSSARCSSASPHELAELLAGRAALGGGLDGAAAGPLPHAASATDAAGRQAVATIGRCGFPVVLFDLDGTVVDSGGDHPRVDAARDAARCSSARSPTTS